ncbi:molybdopterin-dependent oxidoreductase [Myxococcota bacterium]|nr:molybdopterin-dependent oxidoreductase [Myxococcota bacterium]
MAGDGDTIELTFTLNGAPVTVAVPAKGTALPVLRDQLGCATVKAGCSPQGVCGSCAAIVGGKERLTCTLPAKALAGKEVLTHDGLPPVQAELVARAFAAAGLAQAGYEVPGMVMAFFALRAEAQGQPLDADAVRKGLQLHVCRTLGYEAVIAAFLLADRVLSGQDDLPAVPAHLVAAALGRRPSLDDLHRPGLLHAALVLAPQARCRIDAVDPAAALALPGVAAVLTAADLPAALTFGCCIADSPVLVGSGQSTTGCADPVAVVVAASAELARQAAGAVTLATTAEAPELSLNHAAGQADRVLHRVRVQRGEARAVLAQAAHKARLHTETRGADPLFVEPEAALAVPLSGGRFRVYSAGQDLFRDLEQLCALSGLDPDQLEVEHLPAGGAFGARLDLLVAGHALLAAQRTGRPVKLALTMEEGSRLHAGRHPTWIQLELGCDAEGRLLALHGTVLLDTGGHTGAGPIVADAIARNAALAYDVEHVDLDVLLVRTDNPPAGASPGLGVPEYAFAVEGALEQLAAATGLDPLDLRARNLLRPGQVTAAGWTVPDSWNPGPVVEALRPEVDRLRAAGMPVGVAFGALHVGVPGDMAMAEAVVQGPGHVVLYTGMSEAGQGFDTRAILAAAHATGLPMDHFEVRASTARDVPGGPTLAGRDLRLGLPAVRAAAAALARALDEAGGDLSALVGRSFPGEASADPVVGFTAQAAAIGQDGGLSELVVAIATGELDEGAHSVGLLAGAAELGLEAAITAEREVDGGGMPETRWTKLGLLKARHVPPLTLRALRGGPALPVLDTLAVATPAAVANALAAATGQRPDVLPAKDNGVARKMGVRPPKK